MSSYYNMNELNNNHINIWTTFKKPLSAAYSESEKLTLGLLYIW